jgi:pimeloyl-ACP methyl ester carboxylesterase
VIPVQPFQINVAQSVLDDLRDRLRRTRWPDEISGSGWQRGANLGYMQELIRYWADGYDWRAAERLLNQFPQFRAEVGGLKIHFIHERGEGPNPLPLIVTHGWPGSFAEMTKIIPMLAHPGRYGGDPRDAFDVVVPSMPGFGFSEASMRPGLNLWRIGDLWAELMQGLGYQRFGAQGGDFGAGVSTVLGLNHAEHLIGIHLNYIPG